MSKFFHLGHNKIRCRDVSVICDVQKVSGNPLRWQLQLLTTSGIAYAAEYPDEPTATAVHQKLVEACEESE